MTFNNAIIAAQLIANAWNKRKEYMKKSQSKIIVAGLDFAGKTSLINRLMNDYNYGDLIDLEPTIGAKIQEFDSDKMNLIIWDLGGQKSNLEDYLQEPEKFFIQLDILFFVIDAQDDLRYDTSLKYLTDILDILDFIKESPYLLILLHKVDSDIVNDPDFQIKLEYLTDKVTKVFLKKPKNLSFEIIPTSIYNIYSKEPEIVKTIKNVFSKETMTIEEKKSVEINEKIQRILDINLKLMDKLVSELSDIKRILVRLTPSDLKQSIYDIPFDRVPSEYVSTPKRIVKKAQMAEIDNVKKKKKKKKKIAPRPSGVPRPIKLTPPRSKMAEKLEKLEHPINMSEQKVALEKLRAPSPPPKPPPSLPAGQQTLVNPRGQIISELKEMFVKRGISKR